MPHDNRSEVTCPGEFIIIATWTKCPKCFIISILVVRSRAIVSSKFRSTTRRQLRPHATWLVLQVSSNLFYNVTFPPCPAWFMRIPDCGWGMHNAVIISFQRYYLLPLKYNKYKYVLSQNTREKSATVHSRQCAIKIRHYFNYWHVQKRGLRQIWPEWPLSMVVSRGRIMWGIFASLFGEKVEITRKDYLKHVTTKLQKQRLNAIETC